MGETSKSFGELGEEIVDKLLDLVGWKSTPINETLPCIYSKKHKRQSAKGDRTTHGEDSFYIYKSPFFTGQLNHILISSKYTDKAYPDENSATLNTDFSKHFKDLAETMECYSRSTLKNENSQFFSGIDYERIYGVLFWTSGDENTFQKSIFPKLNSTYIQDLKYSAIYLIDSARSAFLYKTVQIIENNYVSKGYKPSFYYIDTGNNPSDKNKKYKDNFLPLELLLSDIQLLLLENESEKILAMIVKDNFSIESLNRIFGLAHNITKGLAKINIHFPDYSTNKHGNDVKRVKRGFQNSNIVDSINVFSYNDNILSLANDDTSLSLPLTIADEIELTHEQILPYGNELRDLLSRSVISKTEMNNLLKEKGVYISEPSKENILPILSSILLSPKEFDRLKENQTTREDGEKRRSSPPLKLTNEVKGKTLIEILPELLNLNDIAKKQFANYDFHNASMSFEMIDNNPNKVQANYKITKHETNKIWFQSRNEYKGGLILELVEDKIELKSTMKDTSSDTKSINNSIKKAIIKDFKNKKFVDESTVEKKILISDFSNQERIDFILAFTTTGSIEVSFQNISNIDIELDGKEILPNDNKIKWMESRVKNLRFDGKKIEEIELITEIKNRKYLICWGIVAEYNFDYKGNEGSCKIDLSFQKNGDNEFEIHILENTIKFKIGMMSKKDLGNYIFDLLDKIKLEKYESILNTKNNK
ncbi:hypothetical protein ACNSOS_00065 [Aliarcobacter vitoriensis]|uniref:GapS4b family protein n=1 Tax=Aliarcobacter vitoriensis TaxID=2011099 RepID=UPI003AAB90B1